MAFDLQINLQTGDLTWNSYRDLAGAQGTALIQQRIHNRLMIRRGTFIYDLSGTLGSRLISLLDMGIPHAAENIEAIIREALDPMPDISIVDVRVNTYNDGSGVVSDPRRIAVKIDYNLVYTGIAANALADNTAQTLNLTLPA